MLDHSTQAAGEHARPRHLGGCKVSTVPLTGRPISMLDHSTQAADEHASRYSCPGAAIHPLPDRRPVCERDDNMGLAVQHPCSYAQPAVQQSSRLPPSGQPAKSTPSHRSVVGCLHAPHLAAHPSSGLLTHAPHSTRLLTPHRRALGDTSRRWAPANGLGSVYTVVGQPREACDLGTIWYSGECSVL